MGSSQGRELRIVVIGKTGVGKSAVGNKILRKKKFISHPHTNYVTTTCEKAVVKRGKRVVTVVDTPGVLDTDLSVDFLKEEILKCVEMSCPGPHVFLLVIQIGHLTKEEKNSLEALQELFVHEAEKFMMILFTRGGDLKGMTINDFILQGDPALRKIMEKCGGRFHVLENKKKKKKQVKELFKKIDNMVAVNGGEYYTDEMYEEVQNHKKKKGEEYLFMPALLQRIGEFQRLLQME